MRRRQDALRCRDSTRRAADECCLAGGKAARPRPPRQARVSVVMLQHIHDGGGRCAPRRRCNTGIPHIGSVPAVFLVVVAAPRLYFTASRGGPSAVANSVHTNNTGALSTMRKRAAR